MSTERDELREILADNNTVRATVDAILAAGYRKPQQVTTVEELDALPFGSIIRDYEDDAWQKFIRGWEVTGGRSEEDSPTLPATVLHVGGAE